MELINNTISKITAIVFALVLTAGCASVTDSNIAAEDFENVETVGQTVDQGDILNGVDEMDPLMGERPNSQTD